ncbi:MAG: winged helix-turn-helix transcriptional regulator [Candidatus Krumholzibacteria bacterium]|nr:winged helix-turn-helix transcriptional regulator [Candidatus Krumholzibacteria bacterium]
MDERRKTYLEAKSRVLKALGHPTRLLIAEELGRGERCVCEFVDMAGVDYSTISRHLNVMKQAGLVEDEKRGKQVFYRLRVPCVLTFMECVEEVIRSGAEERIRMLKQG